MEKEAGRGPDPSEAGTQRAAFRLSGLTCQDCAARVQKTVAALPGITGAEVDLGTARLTCSFDPTAMSVGAIAQAVRGLGYGAEVEGRQDAPEATSFWRRYDRELLTAAAGLFLALGWGLSWGHEPNDVAKGFYAAAMLIGGWPLVQSSLRALREGSVGMDLLMTLAVVGGVLLGEWTEAAMVVFLFGLAHTLETLSLDQARGAIRALMDLAPQEAWLLDGKEPRRVPVEEVPIGARVLVKPGERIAVDGEVVSGHSAVDQAPITGESAPVDKGLGDPVFAGTLNQQGALEVRVTKRAQDTTFARILHRIEEAQAQRAPTQRFVERFAKYYTPAVILLAGLVMLIPPLWFDAPFRAWAYKGLVLLMVSCPCALVLSTPVAVVSGLAAAARHGVLIKGGLHLEEAGRAVAVAFDKTGTLTVGRPEVTQVIPLNGTSREQVLALAAAVERNSEHPLAAAIRRRARQEQVALPSAHDFTALTGLGAQATIDGKVHYVGGPRLFTELGLRDAAATEQLEALPETAGAVVLVGTEEQAAGILTVADQVRDSSATTVQALRSLGLQPMVLLTGDNAMTAQAVGAAVGVDEVRAELLPEDKVAAVRELELRYGRTIMVGDGVNDAPALAAAHVGVAMGAAGTDVALETADIALMGDDLSKLPFAIDLSRKTLRIVKQNIAFALLLKLLFMALTFPGLTTLWMAVGADTGASLAVIANAMRLQRMRPR